LARANAYSALEGLVSKGAARLDAGRPRRYRPEPPPALLARISNNHGEAVERLTRDLESVSIPGTPTLVEVDSGRSVLQLLSHDIARATVSVSLLAPPDAYPLISPALRRPLAAGARLVLFSTGPVDLGFVPVQVAAPHAEAWPGMPVILVVDDRAALVAARDGGDARGHWSTAPAFVAAARLALERMTRS
jgi:sugar-specific transcriptional regulator TrmB